MKEQQSHQCHGGVLKVFEHESAALKCPMTFSVFLPPHASKAPVPFITFLSGLTCTHDNFTTKAGAYKAAAQEGIAIIAPDTSPRGDKAADDPDSYGLGKGAGFYINATQAPWADHYQMETYIADELHDLICKNFPVIENACGITGHSMGGHGALTLGLKHPQQYQSISAFSPIVAPAQVPWGHKAFTHYLGDDQTTWKNHDACALMMEAGDRSGLPEILIDQGTDDQFLEEQLKPALFDEACKQTGQSLTLRMQKGYDHSYYFIQSFIDDHIAHHATILKNLRI